MKKFILITVLFLVWGGSAYSERMESLAAHIKNNKEYFTSPEEQLYVLERCGSVYLYYAARLQKDGKTEISKVYEKYGFMLLESAGDILVNRMKMSYDQADNELVQDVEKLTNNYKKEGLISYLKKGDYFENNIISEDIIFCKEIAESIAKKNNK